MDESSARSILGRLGVTILNRSSSGWLQARCPLAPWTHEKGTDRHPAFGVLVNEVGRSAYKCLACKYKGRVSDLVRTLERFRCEEMTGLAAEADRADMAGAFGTSFDTVAAMDYSYEEPEPINEHAIQGIYPPAHEVRDAMVYLQRRGIGVATSKLLGLCYDPDEARILFPVRGRQRELYGFTGRSILPEEEYPYRHYPKVRDYLGLPKRALLLGSELYQPGKPLFPVEGLFGYASLVQQGARDLCNPVALLGSEVTPQKAYRLSDFGENIYLMPDNDAAGEACLFGELDQSGVHRGDGAIDKLLRKGCIIFVPEWPEGKADPDELTYQDVEFILNNCAPWTPDPLTKKWA